MVDITLERCSNKSRLLLLTTPLLEWVGESSLPVDARISVSGRRGVLGHRCVMTSEVSWFHGVESEKYCIYMYYSKGCPVLLRCPREMS